MPTRYATFARRLGAFIVDSLICSSVVGLFFWILVSWFPDKFVVDGVSLHGVAGSELVRVLLRGFMPGIRAFLLVSLFGGLLYVLYFTLFESGPSQATPGKMLLGIFVTDDQGNRLSYARALGRTMAKLLSQSCCFLGYLVALFTQRSQALHDILAGTLVLEPATPAPLAEQPAPGVESPKS